MKWLTITIALLFFLPTAAYAASTDVSVAVIDASGAEVNRFQPFGSDYRGVASIASGDLGKDGVPEIVIGSGPGLSPNVKVYRQDGSLINEFLAYHESFRQGVNVAVCDLDGNGTNEIVTGAMEGGGPHVRIFSVNGDVLYRGGFFAYAKDFRGGVNVACGDINGDGRADIVTGAGMGGGPHVKVFTPYGILMSEVFSGSALENTGVSVAVGDTNGDSDKEIIAGRMGPGTPTVYVFDDAPSGLNPLLVFEAIRDYTNGLTVTSADVNGDGTDEIGVATSRHTEGSLLFFNQKGQTVSSLSPFTSTEEKGVVAASLANGQTDHMLVMSHGVRDVTEMGKYIRVDISEQRLYAYENGVLANTFLVSTGTYAFPTPLGKTTITDKLLWHDYTWSYGPNNPNNYSLPDVKYNLRFRPHFYIHYAYWHNNFGTRMSHGCVNVNLENSEWIYNWSEVGTTVEVIP